MFLWLVTAEFEMEFSFKVSIGCEKSYTESA